MIEVASRGSLARRHGGPVATAVAFGLLSIPMVAASVFAEPGAYASESVRWRPVGVGPALLLTASAVLPAAAIGGWLGGRLVLARPASGVLLALAVSWPIGIAMLPIAAAVFGIPLQAAVFCFDACTANLTQDPASGIEAYGTSVLVGAAVGGFGLIPAAIGLVGWLVTRRSSALPRVIVVIATYAALHFWSVLYAPVPFACLTAGTLAWARWLRWRDARGAAPSPGAGEP